MLRFNFPEFGSRDHRNIDSVNVINAIQNRPQLVLDYVRLGLIDRFASTGMAVLRASLSK